MKKALVFILILSISSVLFAQQKFALVIGNARYTGISPLSNPENDANDMEAALRSLGFTVTKVLNGNRAQMETAMVNFKQRLSASANSYGFFFYAGHGIQSNGENYLIPVDANIPSENALRDRAVSLQWILAELNDAGNELNIVVLDSCRDNPFSWSRSGTRGLTVVSRAPPGSIVFYATSDGRPAADGTGRNGLFTSNLLNSLRIPDLEINEVLRRTGAAVSQASGGTQIPQYIVQFFGTAYLGPRSSVNPSLAPTVNLLSPADGAGIAGLTALRNQTTFQWNTEADITSSRFVISSNPNPLEGRPAGTRSNPGRTINVDRLGAGTWYWTVEIQTADGLTLSAQPRRIVVQDIPLLPAPGDMAPARNTVIDLQSSRSLSFMWNAVEGANAYIFTLYQQTASGRRQIVQSTVNGTFYTFSNLSQLERGTYMWQVEAVNMRGSTVEQRGRAGESVFVLG